MNLFKRLKNLWEWSATPPVTIEKTGVPNMYKVVDKRITSPKGQAFVVDLEAKDPFDDNSN